MRALEEIMNEIEEVRDSYDVKFNHHDGLSWEAFLKWAEPEIKRLRELSRERRMMMPYKLDTIPDYADVMTLDDFILCVEEGGFIDYDGFGLYVLNGKETNIEVYPSDVKHGAIRKEFDSVAWYNR